MHGTKLLLEGWRRIRRQLHGRDSSGALTAALLLHGHAVLGLLPHAVVGVRQGGSHPSAHHYHHVWGGGHAMRECIGSRSMGGEAERTCA